MTEAAVELADMEAPNLSLVATIPAEHPEQSVITPANAGLNERELAALEQASRGLSIKESAAQSFYAESSIQTHRASVRLKLGTASMSQAVNIAFNIGILKPDEATEYAKALSLTEKKLLINLAWKTTVEVCDTLGIQKDTVRSHTNAIYHKFGATNLAHAIRLGYENGCFDHGPVEKPLMHLTPREQEVLEDTSLGLTNREIGKKTSHSPSTVKEHKKGILRKLGAKNTCEAVYVAIQQGILSIADRQDENYRLTPTQDRVLRLATRGLKSHEIAKSLSISTETVRSHRKQILSEFYANNMAHAVRIACEAGTLEVPQKENTQK